MIIKDTKNCNYFRALDKTLICELLHPDREVQDLDMGFSIVHAILKPKKSSLPHKLKNSVEVYYILEGRGLMHIEGESVEVHPGQAMYIPPNSKQWIENIENSDLKFLCVVKPPWRQEDEELCE